MSHFFAYLSRMKLIRRWGLMHSQHPENVQEHTLRVAMIAHALAVIRNRLFQGNVSPERAATLALYHDASEVLTGDLPTPVKYFNPEIREAYASIEKAANQKLLSLLPEELREDFEPLLQGKDAIDEHQQLVKAADKLCGYLKCLEEVGTGNNEFVRAEESLRQAVEALNLPEVDYFLKTFVPSFQLTLDELE